jgi:signal transduction histidine kinase
LQARPCDLPQADAGGITFEFPDESPQDNLFDRFFRTGAAEENASQGSGLGLAISQAIAQAHGGLIEVTSKENAGTTFRLVFPANA